MAADPLFTPGRVDLAAALARWTWQAEALGTLPRVDVSAIAAAFEGSGVE